MSSDADLDRLIEILNEAETAPDGVRNATNVDDLHRILSDRVTALVEKAGGPAEIERSSEKREGKSKSYVVAIRYETPTEPNDLQPQLRLGLRKPKKEDNGEVANYYPWILGVDVAPRYPADEPVHHAQIRWGMWTHAVKGKGGRLEAPFRHIKAIAGAGSDSFEVFNSIVTGQRLKSAWLTFMGKTRDFDEIVKSGSADSLAKEIAKDIVAIHGAMRRD